MYKDNIDALSVKNAFALVATPESNCEELQSRKLNLKCPLLREPIDPMNGTTVCAYFLQS